MDLDEIIQNHDVTNKWLASAKMRKICFGVTIHPFPLHVVINFWLTLKRLRLFNSFETNAWDLLQNQIILGTLFYGCMFLTFHFNTYYNSGRKSSCW